VNLATVRTLLLDMDGVLYRGKQALPGVNPLLDFCASRGIEYACITNNASMTPEEYEAKLHAMGIAVPASRVLTSAIITNRYLRSTYPQGTTVYAIGMNGLLSLLFGDGYFVPEERTPQLVVQGADFELTYAKLKTACLAIRAGARYIGTNPDTTFPSEEGIIPGAGAMILAMEAATGVKAFIIGKPQPTMFLAAMELLGGTPDTTLMVGDRLDTDILGAQAAGVRAAMVLTGVSTAVEVEAAPVKPDALFADLPALLAAWEAS
jgi:4-nitrophenyl phosphatase